ncbi:MAG: RNA-binding protein S1 [Epulopiscium sp. Nele67-Bin004]|nr:MAG: RNA-binding protein S1 [Epulopiscium sp. Nele67-Bin004]
MSEKFQTGQIIEGTVTGVKPFGAFVALDESTQGLVHISHITHGYLENIADAIAIGDKVKVKVLSIDSGNKKISLSIKEAMPAPPKPAKPAKPQNAGQQQRPPKSNNKPYNNNKRETVAPVDDFESLMKGFLKDSTERQTDINKRLNR